jgi:H+/gluconate symporter-like permease
MPRTRPTTEHLPNTVPDLGAGIVIGMVIGFVICLIVGYLFGFQYVSAVDKLALDKIRSETYSMVSDAELSNMVRESMLPSSTRTKIVPVPQDLWDKAYGDDVEKARKEIERLTAEDAFN